MNRRLFLRSLLGASALIAAPPVVRYVFAPAGGWRRAGLQFMTAKLETLDSSWAAKPLAANAFIGIRGPSRVIQVNSLAELRAAGFDDRYSPEYMAAELYFRQSPFSLTLPRPKGQVTGVNVYPDMEILHA